VDKITLESTDGREVRLRFGPYTLSPREARDFVRELLSSMDWAESLPSIHERHVDLQASCALCRYEAGAQTDRLTYDDEEQRLDHARELRAAAVAVGESNPELAQKLHRQSRDVFEGNEEPMSGERFTELASGRWVVAETEATTMKRSRTIRGTVSDIHIFKGQPVELTIIDSAERQHAVDIRKLRKLTTGGENGKTLVHNGVVSRDYWIRPMKAFHDHIERTMKIEASVDITDEGRLVVIVDTRLGPNMDAGPAKTFTAWVGKSDRYWAVWADREQTKMLDSANTRGEVVYRFARNSMAELAAWSVR